MSKARICSLNTAGRRTGTNVTPRWPPTLLHCRSSSLSPGARQRPLPLSARRPTIPITLVVGLRHDGMVAPFVIDGPMNGTIFLAYVEQCLAPTLRRRDVVIMDNLPAHKVAGVTDAIEAVGARAFYLPLYSPDLNPIEQVFSKLKALLRKAAERTVPKLWRRIRALLRIISDEECLNFFRNAGYAST
jgi:transposase